MSVIAPSESNMLETALEYLNLGWSVIPLCPPNHLSVGKYHSRVCKSMGKCPYFPDRPENQRTEWKEFQSRKPTPEEVESWWKPEYELNIGCALGPVSGIVGIDIDHEDGEKLLLELSAGNIPPTWEYTTGKGRRLVYGLPAGTKVISTPYSRPGSREEILRFMSTGSQIVLPPSRHPAGGVYCWVAGRSPADMPVTPVPEWLISAKRDSKQHTREDREPVKEGGRNNYLTSMAGTMRHAGACPEAILAGIEIENELICDPPLLRYEVENIVYSVAKYERPEFAGVQILQAKGPVDPVPPEALNPKTSDDVAGIIDLKNAGASMRWIWPGWIQYGVLTVVAAEGGTGKTRLAADIVRRVTTEGKWPDGTDCEAWPHKTAVLWVMADNHHGEMVSLTESFGIADRVKINSHPHPEEIYGGISLETAEDLAILERRIKAVRPLFVIVDTVGNATSLNLSKQEDARTFYQPLQVMARRNDVAILCLTHLNASGKVLGRRALEKVRIAWRLSAERINDHTCRRRLEVIKSNSKYPAPLGVTMSDTGNAYDNDPPASVEDRESGGSSGETGKLSQKVAECLDWLTDFIGDGQKRVSEIRTASDLIHNNAKALYAAKTAGGFIETVDAQGKKWWGPPDADAPTIIKIKGVN